MKIVKEKKVLRDALNELRLMGNTIGLVPTMGALHEGHLSLIKKALTYDDKVVVSIFVNPTQFNDPEDLNRYPRTIEEDLELLRRYPIDTVFIPDVLEMYPEKDNRVFELEPLDAVMEGKFRPGHFNGVAQIVSKLFEVAAPDRAYFGMKDFQQLAIIKRIVTTLNLSVEIIGCPIIRENDGLAMSSRNQLLSKEERASAPIINKVLKKAVINYKNKSPEEVMNEVKSTINQHPLMRVDYFVIVDSQSLMPIKRWNDAANKIGCIAVQIGEIRLIDNRYFD